jgi:N-acetyl-alpha-D-muramate 1-phosphate uridylyltransferase
MTVRKAMIFAAGRGERMRPLTDATAKPLLEAGGRRLIEWHLQKLAALGIREVVINTSHLAAQFPQALGDGSRWDLRIHYLDEGPVPLETGGGMLNALPSLGPDPFLLVNGDVWTDFDFSNLPEQPQGDAHLVLVPNPPQHADGDFALADDGSVRADGAAKLTYAGIGVFHPGLFRHWRAIVGEVDGVERQPPRFRLLPLLLDAMRRGAVSGQRHDGRWVDVGTPQRLHELDAGLRQA